MKIIPLDTLFIWDSKNPPPDDKTVLLWKGYEEKENQKSILIYLDNNSDQLRSEYIKYIYDTGQLRFKNKSIVEYLEIERGFSIWWMTLLSEKSPLKSPAIYDCLRLMALEEIIKYKALPKVKLFSDDKNLRLALEKMCDNLQIKFSWEILGHKIIKRSLLRKLFHALPHVIQAIIHLIKFVNVKWPLKKIDKPAWYTGKSTFFFALISFTLNQNYVIKDIII